MRWNDILCEKTIQVPAKTGDLYIIFKNPSRAQFHKLNGRVEWKGLVTTRDIYIWAAWNAHHYEVAHELGLEDAVRIFIQPNGIVAHLSYEDFIRNNPQVKYLYGEKGPDIFSEM